ncbi:MAG: hypothetical protein KAS66_07650 [Candidatus Omnitrophica bacterium]|nr:hypothetical protein [Candidatus Omnitrophota bacterium]
MTINMKDLTGPKLKKGLGLNKATKSYHNKNKSGGNFGIILRETPEGKWFILNGAHDLNGDVYNLSIGSVRLGIPSVGLVSINTYQSVEISQVLNGVVMYMDEYPEA